jgi:hypothetical protein
MMFAFTLPIVSFDSAKSKHVTKAWHCYRVSTACSVCLAWTVMSSADSLNKLHRDRNTRHVSLAITVLAMLLPTNALSITWND